MRRWGLALALLLSVGVNVGLFATALLRRPAPPVRPPAAEIRSLPDPGARLARAANWLGLEGEVRRRFLDLQWSAFQETGRLRIQQSEIRRELRRELTAESPDPAKIDRLLRESSRTFLAMEQTLARQVSATRELLDPAQERKFLALVRSLRPGDLYAPPRRPAQPQQGRFQDEAAPDEDGAEAPREQIEPEMPRAGAARREEMRQRQEERRRLRRERMLERRRPDLAPPV